MTPRTTAQVIAAVKWSTYEERPCHGPPECSGSAPLLEWGSSSDQTLRRQDRTGNSVRPVRFDRPPRHCNGFLLYIRLQAGPADVDYAKIGGARDTKGRHLPYRVAIATPATVSAI